MASPPDNFRNFTVADDDDGIRLDRWFKRHLPEINFNLVSRWARTGLLKVDGGATAHGYDGPWEGAEAASFIARLQKTTFDYWSDQASSLRT